MFSSHDSPFLARNSPELTSSGGESSTFYDLPDILFAVTIGKYLFSQSLLCFTARLPVNFALTQVTLLTRAGLSLAGPLPPTYPEALEQPWVKVSDKVQQLIRSCGPPPGLLIRVCMGASLIGNWALGKRTIAGHSRFHGQCPLLTRSSAG